MDSLFNCDDYALEDAPNAPDNYSSLGIAAEHLAISELIQRGHDVAIPVIDRGIDLIVNWRHKVQIKSIWKRTRQGGEHPYVEIGGSYSINGIGNRERNNASLRPDIDIVLIYDARTASWYVIPRNHITTVKRFTPNEHHRNAWHLIPK